MNWISVAMFLQRLWALLLTPLVFITGASASVMKLAGDDAIQATRREYIYDNDRLLLGAYTDWVAHGSNQMTTVASAATAALAQEAGLDFIIAGNQGRGVHDLDELLDNYGSQGLGVILPDYNAPAAMGWSEEDPTGAWLSLTCDNYKSHPALWGDEVFDEPGASRFPSLRVQTEHYYTLNTGRLPFINLNPSPKDVESQVPGWLRFLLPGTRHTDTWLDAYRRYVAEFISTVDTDVLSVDIYPLRLSGGKRQTGDTWLLVLEALAEAARDTGRDLWAITQAGGTYGRPEDIAIWGEVWTPNTLPDQLQQDYASLAFGAKAIIYAMLQGGWYSDGSHMLDKDGNKTETYDAVQQANAQLRPFAEKYGEYNWRGAYLVKSWKAAGARYDLFNGLPKKERPKISSCDGLLVGCFDKNEGDGNAYVITNIMELRDEKTAACAVTFPAGKAVTVYGGGEVKTYTNGGRVELTLGPGDGRFITVE